MENLTELNDKHFKTKDIAQVSIFSALWIALNLFVAPLSFALTGLPIIHDFLVFFVLLLVVWATGKFGAASFVGVVGSAIVLLAGGPLPMVGFAVCSVLFDLIFVLNHHKVTINRFSVAIASIAAVASAYVAANLTGLLILNLPWAFSSTVWSAENLIGAALSLIVAFPIIGLLKEQRLGKSKIKKTISVNLGSCELWVEVGSWERLGVNTNLVRAMALPLK